MIPVCLAPLHDSDRKPRASGDDPKSIVLNYGATNVNPARAGMIPQSASRPSRHSSKPRASGDDPVKVQTELDIVE